MVTIFHTFVDHPSYISYLCMRTVKALASLPISAVLSEPPLLNIGIKTKILYNAQNVLMVRYENISKTKATLLAIFFKKQAASINLIFLLILANNSTSDAIMFITVNLKSLPC